MTVEQMIIGTFSQSFKKNFYNGLVIGKLAHTEFKDGVKKGDEVDVIMPGTVTMFDYDGSSLQDAELATMSTTKVKINKGKAFHFELAEVEAKKILSAPDLQQQMALASDYTNDAIKQFAVGVDASFANLYTRAGHYLDDNRFAGAWLRNRAIDHVEGRLRLSAELAGRGIDRLIARKALDEFFSTHDEHELCRIALNKCIRQKKSEDKIYASLQRSGFSIKEIRSVLNEQKQ